MFLQYNQSKEQDNCQSIRGAGLPPTAEICIVESVVHHYILYHDVGNLDVIKKVSHQNIYKSRLHKKHG